jgi:hypothetical protein
VRHGLGGASYPVFLFSKIGKRRFNISYPCHKPAQLYEPDSLFPAMGKKRSVKEEEEQESPSPSESSEEGEGDIGHLKASFAADRRKKNAERRKRDRVKKEPAAPKKRAPRKAAVKSEQTEDQSTTTAAVKKRRQPAESPDEKAGKILSSYIYSNLKSLNKDAEITAQSVACLADLIKNHVEATVKRAIHFSSDGKKRVITYQSMWGAVRTLSPNPNITKAMLLSSATVISGVKGSQEQANAAWEAYSEMPEDALEIAATQNLLEEMAD